MFIVRDARLENRLHDRRWLWLRENTAGILIFAPIAWLGAFQLCTFGKIDGNRSLPYKPRQLSAMARFDRGGLFGPETAFNLASIIGLNLNIRRIARSAENDP